MTIERSIGRDPSDMYQLLTHGPRYVYGLLVPRARAVFPKDSAGKKRFSDHVRG